MEHITADILKWLDVARTAIVQNILASAVAIGAGFALHAVGRSFISRAFDRAKRRGQSSRQLSDDAARKLDTARAIILGAFRYAMLAAVAVWVLQLYGVSLASILTVAGIGGLAVGVGAQSLVRDMINGMFIWFEDQYSVGDEVTIGAVSGTVEGFSLRATRVRKYSGELCTIPNSTVSVVSNASRGHMRAIVDIGVPVGVTAGDAIKALKEAFAAAGPTMQGLKESAQVEGVQAFTGTDAANGAVIRASALCEPRALASVEREMRLMAIATMSGLSSARHGDFARQNGASQAAGQEAGQAIGREAGQAVPPCSNKQ